MSKLFQSAHNKSETNCQKDLNEVQLKSDLKKLQLEISDRDRKIDSLQNELFRFQESEKDQISAHVESRLEELFQDLAPLLSQIATQQHLIEKENKSIKAEHILAVSKQILKTCSRYELKLDGCVGDLVSYDPDHYFPLSADSFLETGDQVIIRFPGISLKGKILRKAGVEKMEQME